MKTLLMLSAIGLVMGQAFQTNQSASRPLSQKREVLQSEIAITTRPSAEIAALTTSQPIEHDSEVSRSENVTVVVSIRECTKDEKGACNASADVIAYKPDGSVHSEMKNIILSTGRATASLKLTPEDATGVYRVVATVRDLNARRFGKTERLFGVK
jgi:hypothetical protein